MRNVLRYVNFKINTENQDFKWNKICIDKFWTEMDSTFEEKINDEQKTLQCLKIDAI